MGKTEQIADRLHSAAIHLLRRLRRADEAAGVSSARLSALSVLIYAGPCTMGRLAAIEQVRVPTMSRTVAAMERDGLVLRKRVAGDGRSVQLSASAKGRRVLDRARHARLTLLTGALDSLSAAEREQVRVALPLLERLSAAMDG